MRKARKTQRMHVFKKKKKWSIDKLNLKKIKKKRENFQRMVGIRVETDKKTEEKWKGLDGGENGRREPRI